VIMKHIFTTWVPYCTRIRANREPILSSAPPFLKHIYLNKQSSKNLESVSGAARARLPKLSISRPGSQVKTLLSCNSLHSRR